MRYLITLFFSLSLIGLSAQEICDNGIDDDGDGLIDMNDSLECFCTLSAGGSGVVNSIIPNASFDTNTCCPTSWSQLNCAVGWEQATQPTSDYYNTCGWMPPGTPLPLPAGSGFTAALYLNGWMEMIGSCLTSPMTAGTSYTLEWWIAAIGTNGTLSSSCAMTWADVNVTLYGLTSCPTFPVPTSGCPVPNGWVELGFYTYSLASTWQQASITFTPAADIHAVMIGPPCTLPPGYPSGGACMPYIMYDDLVLNNSAAFGPSSIDITGGWCTNDLVLTGHPDTVGTYQWYLDGVALVGETDTILDVSAGGYTDGLYTFVLDIAGIGCIYSNATVPPTTGPDIQIVDPGPQCEPGPYDLSTLVVNDLNAVPGTTTTFHSAIPANATDMSNQWVGFNMNPPDVVYVMVADPATGCYDVEQVIITWVVVSNTQAFTNETCPGDMDGTITLVGSGGTSPYTYEIGTASNTTGLFTGLGPGTYNYTVTDANGCQSTGSVTIATGNCCPMTNTVASTDETCLGSCDGTITLTETGGAPPVQFSIDNGTNFFPTGNFTGLCGGTYDILIEDANGCQYIDVVVVNDGPPMADPTIDPNGPFCEDDLPSIMTAATSGGTWSGTGITDPVNGVFDPATAGPGTHTITYTITGACGGTDTEDVIVNPLPTVAFSGDVLQGCEPLTVTFTSTSSAGTCLWDFGDGNTSTDCNPTHTYADDGIYDVTLTITDANGCVSSFTATNYIEVFDTPVANFTFGPQPTTFLDPDIYFTDQSVGAAAWAWDFAGLGTSLAQNPTWTFDDIGTYDVTLVVTSANGCVDQITYTVVIHDEFLIYVPNAITMDGDGINDIFFPVIGGGLDENNFTMYIFDRWGELIFEADSPYTPWDGTYKGVPVETEVYVWKINCKDDQGNSHEYIGHVTVLK